MAFSEPASYSVEVGATSLGANSLSFYRVVREEGGGKKVSEVTHLARVSPAVAPCTDHPICDLPRVDILTPLLGKDFYFCTVEGVRKIL